MRAVDKRLLAWGRPTRLYLATSVLLGTIKGALLIAQAWLVATIVAGAFISGRDLTQMRGSPGLLVAVVVAPGPGGLGHRNGRRTAVRRRSSRCSG